MIIGIDLGTTNSLVACIEAGSPKIIPNALGDNLTPSVVGLDDQGRILVGEPAFQRLSTHPDQTVANFKRYMGTDRKLSLGMKNYRVEELSALLLGSLKADAESYLNQKVSDVVISVPAYFNDAQRKATRAAGEMAGLNVRRLINEPTAAAIAYGLHENQEERTFIVFDLGGGTFDVSVLEIFEDVMQVHACAGDNFLGGEDFSEALISHFVTEHSLSFNKLESHQRAALRRQAENCKRLLSSKKDASLKLRLDNSEYQSDINQEQFNALVEPLLQRLRTPVERALRDAGLRASDLDSVVMVGGACRMPVVRKMVSLMFGRIPHATLNFDETVALGVAIQARLIDDDRAFGEVVLTDVMPYSLGTGIHNPNSNDPGELLFSPIIERNSPVPISRVSDFYPVDASQSKVELGVFQGEARYVRDNIKLGSITIPVIPGDVMNSQINVRFTFDLNGILEAEFTLKNDTRRLVIEGNPGVLSRDEIEKSLKALASLKVHPRDKLENASVLARANRLFEERIGDERDMINKEIARFEQALQRQVSEDIEQARVEFAAALDQFDDDPLNN